jgi:hypothetical protein
VSVRRADQEPEHWRRWDRKRTPETGAERIARWFGLYAWLRKECDRLRAQLLAQLEACQVAGSEAIRLDVENAELRDLKAFLDLTTAQRRNELRAAKGQVGLLTKEVEKWEGLYESEHRRAEGVLEAWQELLDKS